MLYFLMILILLGIGVFIGKEIQYWQESRKLSSSFSAEKEKQRLEKQMWSYDGKTKTYSHVTFKD